MIQGVSICRHYVDCRSVVYILGVRKFTFRDVVMFVCGFGCDTSRLLRIWLCKFRVIIFVCRLTSISLSGHAVGDDNRCYLTLEQQPSESDCFGT